MTTPIDKVNAGLETADAALSLGQRIASALGLGDSEVRARWLRSRAAALRARAAVLTIRGKDARATRLRARAAGLDERVSIIAPRSTLAPRSPGSPTRSVTQCPGCFTSPGMPLRPSPSSCGDSGTASTT